MGHYARLPAPAAAIPIVRGFIAGGSIFASAAQAWLSGRISAEAATEDIAENFRELLP
jgi:5-dehydro-2-deoxygluconokinase